MPIALKVFINYRRGDKAGSAVAGRVYDRLADHFGKDNVFLDIDSIRSGQDFVELIKQKVSECDVLIATIGPDWLTIADTNGNRRLDSSDDWVRLEIAMALERGIPVIPMCVYGTPIPKSENLPGPLKSLARKQTVEITHKGFDLEVTHLIEDLEELRTLKLRPMKEAPLKDGTLTKRTRLSGESYVEEAEGIRGSASSVGPLYLPGPAVPTGAHDDLNNHSNRYFNPPSRIPSLGRRLKSGSFDDLLLQLQSHEVLVGLYTNQVGALVATHLHSRNRMDEMERLYAPADGYYALEVEQANQGFDQKVVS